MWSTKELIDKQARFWDARPRRMRWCRRAATCCSGCPDRPGAAVDAADLGPADGGRPAAAAGDDAVPAGFLRWRDRPGRVGGGGVAGDAAGDGRYLRRGPGSPHRRAGLGGGCLALLGCGVLRLPAGQCCPPPLSVTFQAAHHLIPTGVPGCHGVLPAPCSAWRTSLSGTGR
jgi:hypothetical protein